MAALPLDEQSYEIEQVLWKLFGVKLIAYRRGSDGQSIGTGLLNPLFDRLGLFTMLVAQARLYTQYASLPSSKVKKRLQTRLRRRLGPVLSLEP